MRIYQCDCQPDCNCQGCFTKQTKINTLEQKLQDLECKLTSLKAEPKTANKKIPKSKQILHSENFETDADINHRTGLRSKQTFDDLYSYAEPFAKKMLLWQGTKDATTSMHVKSKKSPYKFFNEVRAKPQVTLKG